MPKGDPMQVVALRLSEADRTRLKRHGQRPADAVRKLLDLADGGAKRPNKIPPPVTVSTVHQPTPQTRYVVIVGGLPVYRTTNKSLAQKRAQASPGSTVREEQP